MGGINIANKKDSKDNKPVKKKPNGNKGKPGHGKNSPVIGDNGLMLEPGDNSKYLGVSLQLMNMPKIDMNDSYAVAIRLNEFFQIHSDNDMKPTVAGLGLALNGLDRRRLWEIKTGNYRPYSKLEELPSEVSDLIQKAYKIMENLWGNYMQNGKINPIAGMLLGTNNYGYLNANKIEHILTPNTNADSDINADEIRNKYMLPEDDAEREK